MFRKQRTEVLANADASFLKKLAIIIEKKHDLQVIEEPNSGLVMIKMRESAKNHKFYLGEVFVTECKVLLNGVIGLGILQGAHRKKARYMAIIDAAYNAGVKETALLDEMLLTEKELQDITKQKRIAGILETKVDFETLDEEIKA